MNRLVQWVGYFLLATLFWACAEKKEAANMGEVVRIADGDTFTLLMAGNMQVKVRLHGIDCPERAQPYGTAARKALGDMLEEHRVRIEEQDRDRYGRSVAIAYTDDGLNINETLLKNGFAWHYTDYDKNPEWDKLEASARNQRLGLWQEPNPTPPWEFRKVKRTKSKSKSRN